MTSLNKIESEIIRESALLKSVNDLIPTYKEMGRLTNASYYMRWSKKLEEEINQLKTKRDNLIKQQK